MSQRAIAIIGVAVVGLAALSWYVLKPQDMPGIYQTNGRIEAEQVLVATKFAARVEQLFVDEGQYVNTGDKIAQLDMKQIQAQHKAALAQVQQAEKALIEANTALNVRQEEADLAQSQWLRGKAMKEKGFLPEQDFDKLNTAKQTSQSAVELARAGIEQAEAAVQVAKANAEQLDSVLEDGLILAPRSGRIQYVLTQPGEVLPAGGRLVSLLDLQQVYMTVFVPARIMTRLSMDADSRLTFAALPDVVVPARVTHIASEAQFTPKAVETASERDNLMFKVKLSVPKQLLKKHEKQIKTGVRGEAFVRLDATQQWPETLANVVQF